mgnify:CR=1 FL=1
MDYTFLLASSAISVVLVQIGKDLLGHIEGRWGALASQLVLLAVSFLIGAVGVFFDKLPPNLIANTTTIFVSSMAIYEILYKSLYLKVIKNQ